MRLLDIHYLQRNERLRSLPDSRAWKSCKEYFAMDPIHSSFPSPGTPSEPIDQTRAYYPPTQLCLPLSQTKHTH